MSRRFHRFVTLAALALGGGLVHAVDPDDSFVAVYNLIQATDAQRDSGQSLDAYEGYLKAQTELKRIQKLYPSWNERVINFRLRYVGEKIDALKEAAEAARARATGPGKAQANPSSTPSGEVLLEFQRLTDQITRLNSDKQLLEARLREALSAQPAPVDPRELQRAVDRITALQSTNRVLLERLEQQQMERRNLVERVVAEEAQKALAEANRQLRDQKAAADKLAEERQALETELTRIRDFELRKATQEKGELQTQLNELKATSENAKAIVAANEKLARLQETLAELQKKNEVLAAEKKALEAQIADLEIKRSEEGIVRVAKLENDLAVARAEAARISAKAEELAVALKNERTAREQAEARNRALEERLAALSKEGGGADGTVATLQAALAAEREERTRLDRELKEAEGRLQVMAQASAKGATPELVTQMAALDKEVRQLRSTLGESKVREAEMTGALEAEKKVRGALEAEKKRLETQLHSVAASSAEEDRLISLIEAKVVDLERQRSELDAHLSNARGLVDPQKGGRTRGVRPGLRGAGADR